MSYVPGVQAAARVHYFRHRLQVEEQALSEAAAQNAVRKCPRPSRDCAVQLVYDAAFSKEWCHRRSAGETGRFSAHRMGVDLPKRAEVDTSLLRRSELVEYKRLKRIADSAELVKMVEASNAPMAPVAARRLWVARLVYVIVWLIGIVVAATVGGAMYGSTFAIGAAMSAAFSFGCLLGTAYTFQSSFAADRAKKDALRAVEEYLKIIGYASRRERAGDSDHDDFQYKPRKQIQHEWYGDDSELNWRHREQAGIFDMDADTYLSNFLEHDKD